MTDTTASLKTAVLVGSLRRDSNARKIAKIAMGMLPAGHHAEIVEIGHLPLYNADFDDPDAHWAPRPDSYDHFRDAIRSAHGVFIVTPENNRCIPACLKNAVDIGSKPTGEAVWMNKPVGIMSHSVGRMGGYSSQKNLRLALSYFDMPMLGQPEVFLGQSDRLLPDLPHDTAEFLGRYVQRYATLVEKHA